MHRCSLPEEVRETRSHKESLNVVKSAPSGHLPSSLNPHKGKTISSEESQALKGPMGLQENRVATGVETRSSFLVLGGGRTCRDAEKLFGS